METINEILEYEILNLGNYSLKVSRLIAVLAILAITRFILWIIKKAIFRKYKFSKLDTGSTLAIYQIIKYIVWIMAIGLVLETVGVKVTLLLAGSAALLVGIGLGLQQTFNDIISGFILLTERSIKIGDVLEIDGDVVKIQIIGLRTSKALNRDDISIIIPNSLITTTKVINWSHQSRKTRFKIAVGVAYGSDVDLVIKTLEESAMEHPDIYGKEAIEARLTSFGASSLDFELLFYSKNIFGIDRVKSDIRRIVCQNFAKKDIIISFPQLDLHIKSGTI